MKRLYILMLFCAGLMSYADSESCLQKQQTVTEVPSCPNNEAEWKIKLDAKAKECSLIQQRCQMTEKLFYHCVINAFESKTLEVCAPNITIIGNSCVEYNEGGKTLQESSSVNCSGSCPSFYPSTEVYKYQECFRSVKRKTTDLKNSTQVASRCSERCCDYTAEKTWQIVALVMIIINIAFFIIILRMIILNRNPKKKTKKRNGKRCTDNEPKGAETKLIICHRGTGNGQQEDKTDAAESIRQKPLSENENYESNDVGVFVAALDIGDQYLAMALAYPDSQRGVIPIGSVERISVFERKESGYFIPCTAKELSKSKEGEKLEYLYGFKLSKEKTDEDLYNSILESILERFSNALPDNYKKKSMEPHIYYAFIVPSYWTKTAIDRLRNHILDTEIIEEERIDCKRIHVIRREETLSPFIQHVNARVLCMNFSVGNLVLGPGMEDAIYAILHIGTNYCDLTFRYVDNDKVPDIRPERYELKMLPEENILDFISKIFKEKVLTDWKERFKEDYLLLISEMEKNIKSCKESTDGEVFKITFPNSLINLAIKKYHQKEDDIEGRIAEKKMFCFKNPNTWEIQFQYAFLLECFHEIKENVEKLIENSRKTFNEKSVRCVVMTGTYSHMEMIRSEAERKWFKDRNLNVTLAIPENEQVFAMGGALCVQRKLRNVNN